MFKKQKISIGTGTKRMMLARLKDGGNKLLSLIASSKHGSSNGYGMTRYIRGRDMVDPE